MELEYRFRNHDMGHCLPTSQERINTMYTASTSAARVLPSRRQSSQITPHIPNAAEVEQTLAQMEEEANRANQELIQMHSGLNEQRVARLLGLLH